MQALIISDGKNKDLFYTSSLDKANSSNHLVDNFNDALEVLNRKLFDIILSEKFLWDMDVYQFLYKIRKNKTINGSKFVLISNNVFNSFEKDLQLLLNIDNIIEPPSEPISLITILEDISTKLKNGLRKTIEWKKLELKYYRLYSSFISSKLRDNIYVNNSNYQKNSLLKESSTPNNTLLLFENTPVPMLKVDFSAVKYHIDQLKINDISQIRSYLESNKNFLVNLMDLIIVKSANEPYYKLFKNRSISDLNSNLFQKPIRDCVLESWLNTFDSWLQKKYLFVEEFDANIPTGGLLPITSYRKLLPDADKSWGNVLITIQDRSQLKLVEKQLEESNIWYRNLFESSPMGIIVIIDNTIKFVNQKFIEMYGYQNQKEIIGKMGDIVHDHSIMDRQRNRGFKREKGETVPTIYESIGIKSNGKPFDIRIHASRIKTYHGYATLAFIEDISIHKITQNEQKKSQRKFEVLFNNSPLPVLVVNLGKIKSLLDDLEITSGEKFIKYSESKPNFVNSLLECLKVDLANDKSLETFGLSNKQTINEKLFLHSLNDNIVKTWSDTLISWLDGNVTYSSEITFYDSQHSVRKFQVFRTLLTGSDNLWSSSLIIIIDQTEKIKAEIIVKESEDQFRSLFENSYNPIIITTPNDKVIKMNKAAEDLIGYTIDELQTIGLESLYYNVTDYTVCDSMINGNNYLLNHQFELKAKCGTIKSLMINSIPRYDNVGEIKEYHTIIQDLTKIKEYENKLISHGTQLEQSKARLIEAQSIGKMGNWEWDIINNLLTWSLEMYRIFDINSTELLGKRENHLNLIRHEDISKYTKAVQNAIISGQSYEIEYRINSKEDKVVNEIGRALIDDRGEIIKLVGTVQEITEMKKAEQALIQSKQELYQAQKMEAVGRLAGGIAHDFNNTLTGILGYSTYLKNKFSDNNHLSEIMSEIQKAGERSASLVKQLMVFSKKHIFEPMIINLNDIIRETFKMLERIIGEDIRLSLELCNNLGPIKFDPTQINQILVNLVVNSREAIPNGGTITITTENCFHRFENTEDVPAIMLSVEDTGIGMDFETMSRVFEPFFTTKEHGTGLGLATVYGIVKQNGGTISIESKIDKGSIFKIVFPQSDSFVKNNVKTERNHLNKKYQIKVLLVEDDDIVRNLTTLILEDIGCTVISTSNPNDAIGKLNNEKVDLIISDIIMPGMNGLELVNKIKHEIGYYKILFITGYIERPTFKELSKLNYTILNKPFTPSQLISAIEDIVD